jgi:hypothetical protein
MKSEALRLAPVFTVGLAQRLVEDVLLDAEALRAADQGETHEDGEACPVG